MRARKRAYSKYLVVMLTLLWSAALVSGPIWASAAPDAQAAMTSPISKAQVAEGYGRLPLFFTENQGQLDSKVKYYTRGQGYSIYFTPEGMALSMARSGKSNKGKADRALVQLQPQGIRSGVEILATEPLPGKVNHFQGNDPANWRTEVPTYKSVLYREAYPGIDLKFYGVGQQVEYDLVVKPGADPKQVKFVYQGIKSLKVTKEGELAVNLPGGGKLIQQKPVIYQEINGQRVSRDGKFRILPGTKNRGYGFELASYDARYPLIIDPVVLAYSTYLGGSVWESGNSIAVDAAGNAYIAGTTQSTDFPVVNPIAPGTFNGGPEDAFVTKFNIGGNALVYSTFLGGNGDDSGLGIAVDLAGNAYVTGETFSANFPTLTPFQAALTGVNAAFVTKLSAAGALAYSTFLGGSRDASNVAGTGSSLGISIAVDNAGSAFIAGNTNSIDFPILGGVQAAIGGVTDGFITKLDAAGSGLVYSTYLGGSLTENMWGIAVDSASAAYVVGETNSLNFPTTNASALQGSLDAFVAKINPAGNARVYSFYWGGTGADTATGSVAVDAAGNAYVAGNTDSIDFPRVTPFQNTLNGATNAFVTKFGPTGTAVYSTYLGGNGVDIAWFIAVDQAGKVYVTGETTSTNFPTSQPFQGTLTGSPNAFVTGLSDTGTFLNFSTYLGGNGQDFGFGISADPNGKFYLTGFTISNNFPTRFAIKAAPAVNFVGAAFVGKLSLISMPPIFDLLDE